MSANAKKWVNRAGLAAVVIGVVLILVGGGDPATAIDAAGKVATIGGAVIVFIRELLG